MVRALGQRGGGDCPWFALDETSGLVTSGGQQEILVSIDATGLPEGDYQCDLVFATNDPFQPEVVVTTLLHVSTAASTGDPAQAVEGGPRLFPPFPNPSNRDLRIDFSLPREGRARLEAYDANGRRVAKILDENVSAGRHSHILSGRNDEGDLVPSGVYFYRLKSDRRAEEQKLLRVR